MTTGTATALPNPDDLQPPVTGNDPAALPEGGQQPGAEPTAGEGGIQFLPPQPGDDPDDVALLKAQAAVQAEDTAAGAQPQGDPTQGQDPAQAGATPPAAARPDQRQPAQAAPVMIPKARLDETLQALDKQRLENARLNGMLEATRTMAPAAPGQQQQQQAPQQTPQQRLDAIYAAQDALAARFDAGEITRGDEVKQRRELDNAERAIREEGLRATLQPAAPAKANDELYLETLTANLETKHPWVQVFDVVGTDADWKFLEMKAVENLTAGGKTLDMTKTIDRFNFRKEMSELADQFGPSLVAAKATAKGIALPGTQQQQQQQEQPPLSPAAKTRLAALTRASGAPPDLAAMTGSIGDPTGAISEERLEHISEEDFDKLPAATRAKLLGTSP